ncbi:MAG: polysaccharide deacetylase family protein [Actinomycetota bacterium]
MTDVLALGYHAVSERWPASLSIAPGHLEAHVRMLAGKGFLGVPFHEAVLRPPGAKTVAITFDDAYRSVIELALPILSRVGFRATVFAPTAFVGTEEPMTWPGIDHWRHTDHAHELVPMSWAELERLAEAGWEIGSHTHSHPRLPTLDDAALESELTGSRQEIERRLGAPCPSLAYPYGDHDDRVVEAARRARYETAGTLPARLTRPTGTLDWPRIVVTRADDARRFRWKVSPLLRKARATSAWSVLHAVRQGRR